MKVPTESCGLFCEFMRDSGLIRLTPAQANVCTIIIDAVAVEGEVSNNNWKNFYKFSPQYFQMWNMNNLFWTEPPEETSTIYYT